MQTSSLTVTLCSVITITRGLRIFVLTQRKMGNEENPGVTFTERVISTHQHASETRRHKIGRKCLRTFRQKGGGGEEGGIIRFLFLSELDFHFWLS